VAVPGSIANSLSLLNEYSTDGIVVLADAETIRHGVEDKYMGDTIGRQLSDADIIVLNKVDLVKPDVLVAMNCWLSKLNGQAIVVEAVQSKVPPEVIWASFLGRNHSPGLHLEANHLGMLTLRPVGPIDVAALAKSLAEGDLGIIRAKGFATSNEGKKTLIQVVGRRWETSPAADNFEDGIVCLGFKDALNRAAIADLADL